MALDVIAEAVTIVGQFIIDVLLVGIFYWPGWVILRVVTFGRYPPLQSESHNRQLVAMVALAALLAGVAFYYSGAFA